MSCRACPAVRILLCRISSAYPAVPVLLCQTFVPNVRHVVPARHDAYVLWVRTLDISEGLRLSVNMQYDLSEVLLGVQGVLMCWGGEDVTSAACGRIACVPT